MAASGLAVFARFSDLFPQRSMDQVRYLVGLGRFDLIGLLGTAGIIATTASSYFKFTNLVYRLTESNEEIVKVLKDILEKLP